MVSLTTAIGLLAALCTTVSYLPQVKKCWETGKTGDLSLRMFSILAAGIGGDVPHFVEHCEAVAAEIDVKRR